MKRKLHISKFMLFALVAFLAVLSFSYNFVTNLLYVSKESTASFELKPATINAKN